MIKLLKKPSIVIRPPRRLFCSRPTRRLLCNRLPETRLSPGVVLESLLGSLLEELVIFVV